MADCYMYDSPGRLISLRYLQSEDYKLHAASSLLEAIGELQDIIVPLCADMSLGCRKKTTAWRDWKVQPQKPFHHIYSLSVPEEIVVKHSSDKSIFTPVTKLSNNTIYSWMEKALQQSSPQPNTHEVNWYELDFEAVKVKINDGSLLEKQKFMTVEHDRRGIFRFPLKHCKDGLWVYSPIEDLKTEPSFAIRTGNEEGALTMDIDIHWSWWTEESLKDRNALEAAILRIIARGWTIKHLNKYLELPRLRSIYEASGKLPR